MKKLLLLAGIFTCFQSFQVWKVVHGNGVEKTEEREISGYTSLSGNGPISIDVNYGETNSISIEADENILPYIETKVNNGKLTVKVKDMITIKPIVPVKVHISMKNINSISQSGSGTIAGSGEFMNDGQTFFNVSGSGNINLHFAKFNQAKITMSGSGVLELQGDILQNLEVKQSGSGRINCMKAPCANVTAKLSGSGNLKVNATNAISAQISGSGHIQYTGEATQVNTKVSGSGGIEKI